MKPNKKAEKSIPEKFDTFICYRGATVGDTASIDLADLIYSVISTGDNLGQVFFAPRMKFTYEFLNQAEQIIMNVKRFVIVLNSNFFDGFFVKKGNEIIINPESSTALELNYAFMYECELYPVFTSEFSWQKIKKSTYNHLCKLYGNSNVERLKNRSNVLRGSQRGLAADAIIDYLTTPQLPRPKASIKDKKASIKENTSFQAIKLSRENLISQLNSIHNLVVEKCIATPICNCEVDYGAYVSLIKSGHDEVYHIASGYMNGIRVLKAKGSNITFLGMGYYDIVRQCGLPVVDTFYYWPIDCRAVPTTRQNISICAICFGMLLLYNLKTMDKDTFGIDLPGVSDNDIDSFISGAEALLIALRDYEQFCWMSTWEFKDKGIAGTLNQTTLSLSTLLRCGFLSSESISSMQLYRRFIYI